MKCSPDACHGSGNTALLGTSSPAMRRKQISINYELIRARGAGCGKVSSRRRALGRLIRADKSLSTRFIKKTGNLIIEHSVCSFRLTRLSAVPSMSLILCRGFGNFFCHELLPYHHEAFTHTHVQRLPWTSSFCWLPFEQKIIALCAVHEE